MMVDRKQNKRIASPWVSEVEISIGGLYSTLQSENDDTLRINLVNKYTGEIRQKVVSIDQVVRRCFESEISSWKDIELEDNI
jgi:hypothetical protein